MRSSGPNIADSSEKPNPTDFVPVNGQSNGLVDVLMQIGRERQQRMESLRDGLLRGDDTEALEHARELTGLPSRNSPATAITT